MYVKILGKRWHLKFVPKSRARGWFGLCSHPDTPQRTITVEAGHVQSVELEVTIHECLHAASFPLSEEFVTEFAADVSRILFRLGWRKTDGSTDSEA